MRGDSRESRPGPPREHEARAPPAEDRYRSSETREKDPSYRCAHNAVSLHFKSLLLLGASKQYHCVSTEKKVMIATTVVEITTIIVRKMSRTQNASGNPGMGGESQRVGLTFNCSEIKLIFCMKKKHLVLKIKDFFFCIVTI